jgi:hypothetical protein
VIASWIVFPLVLWLICHGCGLLIRAAARSEISGVLVAPLGFAAVILIGEFASIFTFTAELAAPVAVAAALAGFLLSRALLSSRLDRWAMGAALAVFAVYAAPIVLSGHPTFAGYIKLDDTATWMALTDRIVDHGRDIGGLAHSSYERTLIFNLASGYPIGAFGPLAIGSSLLGRDPLWIFQPYMAFMALLLALCLYGLARPLVPSRVLRAIVAFLAAQPAILFGYYLWGGVKEMASAVLLALLAALAPSALEAWRSWRMALPAAIVAASVVALLSAGGGALWLAPMLVVAGGVGVARFGWRKTLIAVAVLLGIVTVVSAPWLIDGGLLPRDSKALADSSELGNLLGPLNVWQAWGIWPAGDFRLAPSDSVVTGVLIAVAVAAALAELAFSWRKHSMARPIVLGSFALSGAVVMVGSWVDDKALASVLIAVAVGAALAWLAFSWRERALAPAIFLASLVLGGAAVLAIGGPWIDGKALATVSPALLFAATLGATVLITRGFRTEGTIALAAIALGVLWSNALAYSNVWLAPFDRLSELDSIGHRIAGEGPTLMTDYEPYGVRHLLRNADPEGAAELRWRPVYLRDGKELHEGQFADIDEFALRSLLVYRTLVLRRSPVASRPPLPFRLAEKGRYWEVWQQDGSTPPLDHLPGQSDPNPSTVLPCGEITALAAEPGAGGLVASVRPDPAIIPLSSLSLPDGWRLDSPGSWVAYPERPGTATGSFDVPRDAEYGLWIGGSDHGKVDVRVDGRYVGGETGVLDHVGQYRELGRLWLHPGAHRVALTYDNGGLAPGAGTSPSALGPLAVSAATAAESRLLPVPTSDAASLCGRRLDWVEAVAR